MRNLLYAVPAMLAIAASGCNEGSSKPTRPHSDYFPRTTISGVIENLKLSYTRMELSEFAPLFADSFRFVFAPEDVGGPDNIPESWGREDELLSAQHLFSKQANRDGYVGRGITLNFTIGPEESPPGYPGWRFVELRQLHLGVDSNHPEDGDQLLYEIVGSRELLYFVQTEETDPYSGGKIWKIIRWEDKPIGGGKTGTEETTWGAVKTLWR